MPQGSPGPGGAAVDTFVRREDAERFIEEVRGDDPELASYLGSRSASSRRAERAAWMFLLLRLR